MSDEFSYAFEDLLEAAQSLERQMTENSKLKGIIELYATMQVMNEEINKAKAVLDHRKEKLEEVKELLKTTLYPIVEKEPHRKIGCEFEGDESVFLFDAAIQGGKDSITIHTKPENLPKAYQRIKVEADKIALKKGIKDEIVGPELATLNPGEDYLIIKLTRV